MDKILNFLYEQRSFDFSGNRTSMLKRRISKRLFATRTKDYFDYYTHLLNHPEELDKLLDVLTINVSSFFRDPLVWEVLAKNIIPNLLEVKKNNKESFIRVWSAGCSTGEEPYSLAILLKEQLEKDNLDLSTHIFGTDIGNASLLKAEKARYAPEEIKDMKLGLFRKYFIENSDKFDLNSEIKKMVKLSEFDLLDKNKCIPADSVFGNFDIVMCRNVLIYFNTDSQDIIFDKLYRSLNTGGYLILGEAEVPVENYKNKFTGIDKCCKIYQKR